MNILKIMQQMCVCIFLKRDSSNFIRIPNRFKIYSQLHKNIKNDTAVFYKLLVICEAHVIKLNRKQLGHLWFQ